MQKTPSDPWEFIAPLGQSERFGLLLACLLALVVLAAIVALLLYGMHRSRLNIGLKRELLDRGFSAEEIVAVVAAKPAKTAFLAPMRSSPSSLPSLGKAP